MWQVDRSLLILTILLVISGFLILSSASLGLLARDGARFSGVAMNQFLFGIIGGLGALFITTSIHYRFWRQYAFYFFLLSALLTLAVFTNLGFEHGGARRWLDFGFFTIQPAELLKIGFIIYIATWVSGMKHSIDNFMSGTLPFIGFLSVVAGLLLFQPDTDTFLIIGTAALAIFIVGGGRVRDVFLMIISGIVLVAILALMRPYVKERILTFIDPGRDPLGAGYQINQSLIAIGSGDVFGRGYGQSIQKFEYLPEPISDSIFAVFAEEFGFLGSSILVVLFGFFILRGFRIATRAPDLFGMLLVVGITTLIAMQTFLNIAAMLGLAPLSGLPLPFISHGGTALLVTLASVGIILNVSKYQKPIQ
jgi:cell division protein FtsW